VAIDKSKYDLRFRFLKQEVESVALGLLSLS